MGPQVILKVIQIFNFKKFVAIQQCAQTHQQSKQPKNHPSIVIEGLIQSIKSCQFTKMKRHGVLQDISSQNSLKNYSNFIKG